MAQKDLSFISTVVLLRDTHGTNKEIQQVGTTLAGSMLDVLSPHCSCMTLGRINSHWLRKETHQYRVSEPCY